MQKKVQFPSLNGLRFLAAFGVLVSHVEKEKFLFGMPSIWCGDTSPIYKLGQLSVSLFFVLSGFLITFLLLEELELFKSISVKAFYIRRMLRIWPLYYIIVFLSFVVMPAFSLYHNPPYAPVWDQYGWLKAILYVVFSPHVADVCLPAVAFASPLWSVGVEEWFYAMWPWIVKYASGAEALARSMLAIIVLRLLACIVLPLCNTQLAVLVIGMLRFDCMAIGGLFALLLTNRHLLPAQRTLSILYRKDVQFLVYLLLAAALYYGWDFGLVNDTFYSLLFGTVILNLASNKQSILNLENPVMHWLGNVSYGLYCYNRLVIEGAILLILPLVPHAPYVVIIPLLYAVVIILNVAVAGFSYEFIERRFLLLKQKSFTRVPSLSVESSSQFRSADAAG